MKDVYIVIGCAVILAAFWLLVVTYGKSQWNDGYHSALLANAKTENASLVQSAQTMADAYQTVATSLGELATEKDDATLPSLGPTIERLRSQRQAAGVSGQDSAAPPVPVQKPRS